MRLIWLCAVALIAGGLSAPWIDSARGQSSIQGDQVEDTIETWIEMLDSPRYSDRVEATAKLQRSGAGAIKALHHAVLDGEVETSNRALDILRRHFLGEDPVLRNAAETTLRDIADRDHPKAHAAARVLESAEREAGAEVQPMLPPFPLIAPVPIFGNRAAGNQIFGNAIGGNPPIKIQVKIVNGDKEVTIEENGKKIHVAEKSDGIEVERTDEKGNKKKTRFKDLEELKKQDPEAHKAYQRAGAGIRIQIGGGGPRAPQAKLPDDIRKQRQEMLDRRDEILKRHEQLRKQHLEMIEKMRRSAPPNTTPPSDDGDAELNTEAGDKLPVDPPIDALKV